VRENAWKLFLTTTASAAGAGMAVSASSGDTPAVGAYAFLEDGVGPRSTLRVLLTAKAPRGALQTTALERRMAQWHAQRHRHSAGVRAVCESAGALAARERDAGVRRGLAADAVASGVERDAARAALRVRVVLNCSNRLPMPVNRKPSLLLNAGASE